jgi:hypothetical protein
MTVIAFGVGCSYRRTLEEWPARSEITPERVLEFGSYHAIVAGAANCLSQICVGQEWTFGANSPASLRVLELL